MKTPQEWLKEIHHLSDTEVRHGSTVILLESDIEKIQQEAWNQATNNAILIQQGKNPYEPTPN